MGEYRITRDVEASIIDFLKPLFLADWSSEQVEKTFKRAYELPLPSIVIRVGDTEHDRAEVGDNATIRTAQVLIDIFAENDGQRLDIKDWLISAIKNGCPYYEYTITNGAVSNKTQNGRIRVLTIEDVPVNFNIQKNDLEVHDKYRHLITLGISIGRIEV